MIRLLIADDEKNIRLGLKAMVEREFPGDFECYTAEDGQQAWNQASEKRVDIVITDIRMPQMDGIQLMRQLRNLRPRPLVAVLSGYGEFQYAKEAIHCGAQEYLLKPVIREDLFTMLREMEHTIQAREVPNREREARQAAIRQEKEGGRGRSYELDRAVEYIHKHYKENLNMAVVSNLISLNYTYFSHAFKSYTGVSFVQYVRNVRIHKSKELLERTEFRIYEVAAAVGFESAKHFNKVFREKEGITPQEYRVRYHAVRRSGG
ncbi:response regulator transcription factor [Paenibacillus medicaginis]|uniref:Response regulator n=1 Tax=Paenibacillus medicaginis TaxID=1470560 RepID=A0ABV5C719_9BACL